MGKVSESIFNGKNVIVPMADVQHIEKQCNSDGKLLSISIITKHTTWDFDNCCWENNISIGDCYNQAEEFLKAWCYYRYELESEVTNGNSK